MKYYSEDTVRKIVRSVAHTALEQMDNFADAVLAYQPNIELPDKHGRLIDADKLREALLSDEDDRFFTIEDIDEVDNAPTVLEANNVF